MRFSSVEALFEAPPRHSLPSNLSQLGIGGRAGGLERSTSLSTNPLIILPVKGECATVNPGVSARLFRGTFCMAANAKQLGIALASVHHVAPQRATRKIVRPCADLSPHVCARRLCFLAASGTA